MSLFDSREFRIAAPVTLAAAFLAVLITVIAGLAGRDEKAPPVRELKEEQTETLSLSDFIRESDFQPAGISWKEARPRREKWSELEIERFWQDPARAGMEKLSEENDELLRTYFLSNQ